MLKLKSAALISAVKLCFSPVEAATAMCAYAAQGRSCSTAQHFKMLKIIYIFLPKYIWD